MDNTGANNQTPRDGQPKLPENNTPPKRVIRTYQSDLAKLHKELPQDLKKEEKEKAPKKEVAKPPKTPPAKVLPPKQNDVELQNRMLSKEEETHYVEEIHPTDHIELRKEDMLSKEDFGSSTPTPPQPPTPPKPRPMPAPKPLPKKEDPIVIKEEGSAPQQNLFASIMAWLLGGTGNDTPKKPAPSNPVPPVEPKKLESIPVIPKVEKKEAPEPVTEVPPAAPAMPAPPLPPQPAKEPSSSLFSAPKPKAPPLPPKPVAPPIPPRQELRAEDIKPASPIKTYTSDARKGIKDRKETPLSVLAKQQDTKKAPPKREVPKKKSSLPLIAGAVGLIILGIVLVGGTFAYLSSPEEPTQTTPRVVTPVFAESRTKVSASNTPTLRDLSPLISQVETPQGNALVHITFAKPGEVGEEIIPFSEILLRSDVPGTLSRSVYPQSMLGVFGTAKEPVMILAVSSFERSFKGLLSWEDTMSTTLAPLFGPLETTATSTTTPAYVEAFVDEELETTDVRILYDATGNTHIVYGFITPEIVFITKTKATFLELTDRIVRE